ncbi:MAG: hypothetical protein RDV41_15930 [Planctomycetota bacterium]|nr:hypothetical protein [Planctomycetota bacterium]
MFRRVLLPACAVLLLTVGIGCTRLQRVQRDLCEPRCRILNIYPERVLPGEPRKIIVEGELLSQMPVVVSVNGFESPLVALNDNFGFFEVRYSSTSRCCVEYVLPGRKITRCAPLPTTYLTVHDVYTGFTGIVRLMKSMCLDPELVSHVEHVLSTSYVQICDDNFEPAYKQMESLFFYLRDCGKVPDNVALVVLDLLTFYREALLLDLIEP